jgi:sulfate transport system substrate-binding protein
LSLLVGGLGLYAIWPWLPGQRQQTRTLVVYGFSILGEVMTGGIFPAFQAEWLAQSGEHVEFISSFAGSGTITNQVIFGVPAEVVILSLELDAQRLVEAGVLPGSTWLDLPYQGVLNRTPFIILVRPGNPQGILDFADLARPGVGVVHPDPLTSGGAQWAILAEYGSALRVSNDPDLAYQQLLGIWRNVVAQSSSARGARTQFENGFGDALITYEQEALYDKARDRLTAEIVYPTSTILSEHTVVVIDKNIVPEQRELVEAFIAFLWSFEAQQIFTQYGFHSVDESLSAANLDFGTISEPFLVSDLGGWTEAKRHIIDAVWLNRVLPEIGQ